MDSFEFNLEKLKIQMTFSDCMFVPSEFLMPHAGVQYKKLSDLGMDCLKNKCLFAEFIQSIFFIVVSLGNMHFLIFKKHGICKNLYKILVHVREHFISIHYHQRKVMKEFYLLLANDILEFTMLAIRMLWLEKSAFQAHKKSFDHLMYARERFRAICRVVDHQTSDHLCSWINPFAAEGVFYTGQAARWFSVRKREHANLMTCPWKEKNQLPSYEWFRHKLQSVDSRHCCSWTPHLHLSWSCLRTRLSRLCAQCPIDLLSKISWSSTNWGRCLVLANRAQHAKSHQSMQFMHRRTQ